MKPGYFILITLSYAKYYSAAEWSLLLKKGDKKAFRLLFETYWDRVFTVCVRYTDCEADAEDMTQSVFLSLWERHESIEIQEDIEKYLHKAAKYQVSNYIRAKVKQRDRRNALDTNKPPDSYDPGPDQLLCLKELASDSDHYINGLPEPGRTYFILNREHNLSYRQIALQYGVSVKTVEYHISNILRILKKQLKSWL